MAVTVDTESEFPDELVSEWILNRIFNNAIYLDAFAGVNDQRWFGEKNEVGTLICVVVASYRKHGVPPTRDAVVGNLRYLDEKEVLGFDLQQITQTFDRITSNKIDVDDETVREAMELFVKKSGMYNAMQDFFRSQTGIDDRRRKVTFADTYAAISKFNDFKMDDNTGMDALTDEALEEEYAYLTTANEKLETGIEYLDKVTNGGILRNKFLGTIAAGANVGKSLCAAHLAYKSLCMDRTVMIATLEMSEKVYSRRILAQISGCNIDLLGVQIKEVRRNVDAFRKAHPNARLIIKEFAPSSTSTSQIESFIDDLEKKGTKIDVLFVDYLNLLKPNHSNKTDQQFQKVQQVCEELRALTYTHDFPCWTMTQTNRASMIDVSPKLSDIAQSMGAACTSDLVVTLYTTSDEEGEGVINMTITKSRLGSKNYVPHRFIIDQDTLALIDDGDSGHGDGGVGAVKDALASWSAKKDGQHANENVPTETKALPTPPTPQGTSSPTLSALDRDFNDLF